MSGFSARNFVPNYETAEELENALANPLQNDEELENFLGQVDQVSEIIRGLTSNDTKEQEKALRKADILIREEGDGPDIDPDNVKCVVTQNRTVINKVKEDGDTKGDMSQEAFMKAVEKDANERTEKKKIRKEQSDAFRKKGNKMFREKDYAGALFNYNEAIKLIKDSPCLYNNRALTYIRIGIYSSALEDCERALDLEPHSIRGRMLKAKSLFHIGEPEKCRDYLEEARIVMPHHKKIIDDCENNLFTMGECDAKKDEQFEFDLSNEKVWKKAELNEWS